MFLFVLRYIYLLIVIALEVVLLLNITNKKLLNVSLIFIAGYSLLFRIFNRADRLSDVAPLIEQYPFLVIVYYLLIAIATVLIYAVIKKLKVNKSSS